jgi:hypothetical protein
MPNKRSSKTQDMDRIAADLLEEAVGEPAPITPVGKKNPAAANSRRGGDLKPGAGTVEAKAKVKVKAMAKVKVKGPSLKKRKA